MYLYCTLYTVYSIFLLGDGLCIKLLSTLLLTCQNAQDEKNRGVINSDYYVCNAIYKVKNLILKQILNIIDLQNKER